MLAAIYGDAAVRFDPPMQLHLRAPPAPPAPALALSLTAGTGYPDQDVAPTGIGDTS